MARKLSIQGEVQINKCSPHKFLEMFRGRQEHIPNICSHIINGIEARHGGCRWNYVHRGLNVYNLKNKERNHCTKSLIIDKPQQGDIMKKFYKTFVSTIGAIPKGEGCLVKWSIEYEKLKEDAPEPHAELESVLGLAKGLGDHHLTIP